MYIRGVNPGLLARGLVLAALLSLPPALVVAAIPPPEPADLVFVNGPEPETLDPAVAARIGDVRLCSALFEPLVALDPDTLEPRPAAARSFEVRAGEGGATFARFALHPGLRWSNGEPLVAEDFVAAWRRAAEPATGAPLAAEAREVAAGARATGPAEIEIILPAPRPDLLQLLSLPAFAPVHRSIATGKPGDVVGNGPFRLEKWEPGRRLRLVRNEHYRAAAKVALGSIEALTTGGGVSGGDATAFQIYETGGADLVFAVPSRAASKLRAAGRRDLHEREGARTYFLRFNPTRPPLDDPVLRRSLSSAIDRASICRYVLRGGETPATGLVPPGLFGHGHGHGHGPAPAPAPAPAPSPRPLAYLYPATDDSAAQIGEVLQSAFAPLGVHLRLHPAEPKAAFASVKRLEYDIAWGNWTADYPDPANFLGIFRSGSGNNRTGFRDPEYDALLDRAAAAPAPADRAALLAAAEARLLAAAPLAPLFFTPVTVLARPNLRGGRVDAPFAHVIPWANLEIARP